MAQFLRPNSNVTQTSFTGGFAEIDESSASDADFAYGANNTAAVLEVGLSDPTTPGSGTCTVRYRIAKTNAGTVDGGGNAVTVTGAVFEGTTSIQADSARTATGTWTEYSFTFAASAVTDWTDVRLRFTTSSSGGSPANRRGGAVSWGEIETPDAADPPLEPEQGSYALTGQDAALRVARVLDADQGSYALSGQSISFSDTIHWTAGGPAPLPHLGLLLEGGAGYTLAFDQGSYSLTGQDAALRAGREVDAAQGSYTLDGQAVGLKRGFPIVATQESYTLSGQAADLRADRNLAFAQGAYALSGQSVTLTYGHPMSAVQGSYSLDGQAASLVYGHPMPGASGSYSLSGQAAALTAQRMLAAAQGSYSLNGQTVFLLSGDVMAAEQGAYTLSGQTVTLLAARTLALDDGAYALDGQAQAFAHARKVPAAQGSYSLDGQAAALLAARTLALAQGEYALNGQDVTLTYSAGEKILAAEAGSYALDGQAVTLTYTPIAAEEAPARGGGNPSLTRKQFKEHLERIRRQRDPGVQSEVFAGNAESAGQVFVFAPVTELRKAVVIPAPIKVRKSRKRRDEEELLMGLLD